MTGFEERLRGFRTQFVDRAAIDAETIDQQAASGNWQAIRDLSHGLVGRAGMFGFSEQSEMAKILESAVEADQPAEVLQELSLALAASLRRLRAND